MRLSSEGPGARTRTQRRGLRDPEANSPWDSWNWRSTEAGEAPVGSWPTHPQADPRPSLPTPRWLYEGLSREKAEELLLLPGNHGGAFLIRESQTRRGG